MRRPPKAARTRLCLDGLAHGGDAVGRDAGRVWFVPYGVPGEVVLAAPAEEKPSFVRGTIVEIVTPSADRTEPRCQHFGACGGCQWQHLGYDAQLREKELMVAGALRKVTSVAIPKIITAPEPYGYRVRAELHVVAHGDGCVAGYRRARSHEVVSPTMCPITEPRLEAAVLALVRLVKAVPGAAIGRYELHLGENGVSLCAHVQSGDAQLAARWLQRVLEDLPHLTACVVRGELHAQLVLREGGVTREGVTYSAGVFGQGHHALSGRLRDEVIALAAPRRASVLELFAGAGLFSLPLGRAARRLVTAEENTLAAADARRNLATAGITADVRTGSARQVLLRLKEEGQRFDVAVLDPPRKGAEGELPLLCDLAPQRIVYVSCDPMTLGRDLLAIKPDGYVVRELRVFDLFPQTFHVEVVALLERQGRIG